MKVLIIGSGGREHAFAWKVAQSPRVTQIFVAPGNAGTAHEHKTSNINIGVEDIAGPIKFAQQEKIDLTIVGPEGPLVIGVVDAFEQVGLRCFGPRKSAAQVEGSKAFTKDFLKRHRIPTAAYANFTKENFDANWVRKQTAPLVVKADGLAAGKGVIICQTTDEAVRTAQEMFSGSFGNAGNTIVIEEFLQGEEASFIAIIDGKNILPMATSQDHKRIFDNDQGPNTGGMGAYSPAPVVTPAVHARIMREVMEPTVKGLASEGTPFTGFLYAGIMVAPDGTPNVIEFNCRFGDPETQPIMMRLKSDLVDLIEAALDGKLDKAKDKWDTRAALGVVIAAGGYPDTPRKGDVIHGLESAAKLPGKVFHAGTQQRGDDIVTSGGRVLCATGLGNTVLEAQQQAYELAKCITWDGVQYRHDIGYRAIARERVKI